MVERTSCGGQRRPDPCDERLSAHPAPPTRGSPVPRWPLLPPSSTACVGRSTLAHLRFCSSLNPRFSFFPSHLSEVPVNLPTPTPEARRQFASCSSLVCLCSGLLFACATSRVHHTFCARREILFLPFQTSSVLKLEALSYSSL